MLALVCKDLYDILKIRRNQVHKTDKWKSYVTPFCNTPDRIEGVLKTVPIKYLRDDYDRLISSVCKALKLEASKKGYTEMVQYCTNRVDLNSVEIFANAMENKQYNMIITLINTGYTVPIKFLKKVIPTGNLELVKTVINKMHTIDEVSWSDVLMAITTDNPELIKIIHDICKTYSDVWYSSHFYEFNIRILKYVHEVMGIALTRNTIEIAVHHKLWNHCEYLISKKCPIGEYSYINLKSSMPNLAEKIDPELIIYPRPDIVCGLFD
jgi:hypothetical protein